MEFTLKDYLDLLTPYRSEEGKRARRNVNAASFIVLLVWLLNARVESVTVFSVDLPPGSERALLWITFALLVYWTETFWFTSIRDRGMQKERAMILQEAVAILRRQVETGQVYDAHRGITTLPNPAAAGFVAAYDQHVERTKKTAALGRVIDAAEWLVPATLSTAASCVVIWWLYLGEVRGLQFGN